MKDRRGILAALLAVVAAGGVLAADTLAPPPEQPVQPEPIVAATDPVGGSAVCGVGDTEDGEDLLVVASRPTSGRAGPAQLEVERFTDGTVEVTEVPPVFPGAAASETLDDEAELSGTSVTWRDAPATVWREWSLEGVGDLPDATVAGSCAAPSSDRWIIPGMSTDGGNEARLRLTNPFGSAATVAVGFLTPDGVAEPLVLRNLSVPAGSVREIVVNETLPEEPDLTAIVEVASGRMSVEGVQLARSAIGGVDGASLLAAAPAAAEAWTMPWVSDGAVSSSWLWIANPGERTAAVELSFHTPAGGELPNGLAEVSVPPGEMRRVDLEGTFPQEVRTAAVTARTNGTPIVVSAGTQLAPEDPAGSAVAVQLGAATDASWVVSGGPARDRSEQLHLSNPTGAAAVVDVALFNGVVSSAPSALQDVEVAAGSSVVLDLTQELDGRSVWSAFVTASSGEIVVGRVGRSTADDAPLRLVAAPGVPSAAWASRQGGLAAAERDGLVRGVRTSAGVDGRAPDEFLDDAGDDLDPDGPGPEDLDPDG